MPRAITATSDTPIFSADPIVRGNNLGVFGRVTNTSSAKARLTVTVTATLSSDVYIIAQMTIRFNAGQALLISTVWSVPVSATAGDYTVAVAVEANNSTIATGSDTLTVSAS